jgi:hypothetical protein
MAKNDEGKKRQYTVEDRIPPTIPINWADWEGDPNTMRMSETEEGIFFRFLRKQWSWISFRPTPGSLRDCCAASIETPSGSCPSGGIFLGARRAERRRNISRGTVLHQLNISATSALCQRKSSACAAL